MTHGSMSWEFAELFHELDSEQINEMLAKNVPLETLNFFSEYAETFAEAEGISEDLRKKLPNLMLMGYLIRVLEDRLQDDLKNP